MKKHYRCRCGGELRIYWSSLEMECLRDCRRPRPNRWSKRVIEMVHEAIKLDDLHKEVLGR
jgi:hypothetical protein